MCNDNSRNIEQAPIHSNKSITNGIFEMTIEAPELARKAVPGQFVNLYCRSAERLLPRPISISDIDAEHGTIKVIYAVVGKGTREFSTFKRGEFIRILGPLGNGYSICRDDRKSIIVAGGVGTPPMIALAKNLSGDISIFLGFRTNPYLVDRLSRYGEVHVATDDGSFGTKGNVVDLLNSVKPGGDMLYACGPKPMLHAVRGWAEDNDIPGQLSLEERMGCGIGTCVGCVVRIKNDSEQGWEYKKVCKDGPVFRSGEVLF